MTKGKKAARAVLRALFAGFLVLLALSYKKPGTRTEAKGPDIAATLASEAPDGARDRVRFRGFDYVETRASEGTYRLTAAEALGYEDKGEPIFRLKDVVFESQESRPGQAVVITAPRAEFAQRSRAVRVFEGVRISGQGTNLNGASFRYEPVHRVFRSEGPVTASRGSLVGRAESGQLETRDGVLTLEGRVRMRGRVDGAQPLDLAAPLVRMTREGTLQAERGVTVKSADSVLRSEVFERGVEGEGDRLRAQGAAWLILARSPREGPPLIAQGDLLDLLRDAAGQPTHLTLTREAADARLDMAPGASGGARLALARSFEARLVDGRLKEITVPVPLTASESASASKSAAQGAGMRTLTAGFARLTFAGDGRTLDVAVFDRGVVLTDGTRAVLRAPHGTLRGEDQTAVFSGEPGQPADYRDEKGTLVAKTIAYRRAEDVVDASGEVRASYSGPRRTGFLGGSPGEPFFSESETLHLATPEQKLTLKGSVRAWQGENVLRSGLLEVNDSTRTLVAREKVQAFFRRHPAAGAPAPAKRMTETVNANGDSLAYREADHIVRIEGHTKVVSGVWAIDSDVTEIRLATDLSVEYAEANGDVRLEDRTLHRRGEGAKATWRPQAELITLDGSPAVAIDGKGNRLTGAVLTFRQGRSRVDVEGSPAVGSEAVLKPEGS